MTRYTAAEVFPPGEILKDELEARGWTQTDLAEVLGRPPRVVNEIVTGRRGITPETAKGLAEALGTTAQFWMNLESAWQLSKIRPESGDVARRSRLYAKAPIKEMVRRSWIEPSTSIEVLEARVLAFLGIASLDETPELRHAARKQTSYRGVTPAQNALLCRARQLAKATIASRFTKEGFEAVITTLKRLLLNPEDVRQVPRVLADAGVRFVIVEPLSGTHIDGAILRLDDDSPVIALSLRYDRIDWFWFTLMHEIGHIKAGDALHLDTNLVGEGATKTEDKPQNEVAADEFATESLITSAELDGFIARVHPLYYKEKIRGFASRIGVHPGLVVGQLQFRGRISYAHNREMLAKVRAMVSREAPTDGWGCTPPVVL